MRVLLHDESLPILNNVTAEVRISTYELQGRHLRTTVNTNNFVQYKLYFSCWVHSGVCGNPALLLPKISEYPKHGLEIVPGELKPRHNIPHTSSFYALACQSEHI